MLVVESLSDLADGGLFILYLIYFFVFSKDNDLSFETATKESKVEMETKDSKVFVSENGFLSQIYEDIKNKLFADNNELLTIKKVEEEFKIDFKDYFSDALESLKEFEDAQLLKITDNKIEVSQTGSMLIRNICMPFDAYLNKIPEEKRNILILQPNTISYFGRFAVDTWMQDYNTSITRVSPKGYNKTQIYHEFGRLYPNVHKNQIEFVEFIHD